MKITVKYLAQLKHAAGLASETVEVPPGHTIQALLHDLAGQRPEAFRRIVLDSQGRRQPSVLFFLGDEQVRPETCRALQDGDTVTLLTPMAGG